MNFNYVTKSHHNDKWRLCLILACESNMRDMDMGMKAAFSVSSAIENLERQKIRKEIARVRKLTDQKDLKKIIESEANDSVRRVAVENLTEVENFINQKFNCVRLILLQLHFDTFSRYVKLSRKT